MKHIKEKILITVSAILLIFCFTQCKNDNEELLHNVVLYNQPLSTIKKYINGKWKLEYIYGGFSSHKEIETHHSYMIINSDHITMGDDSRGIVVDTTIVWERTDIGTKDYTYLMSFSWSGSLWPDYQIIDQIKNDTLIVRDYVSDGYDNYYTKY